MRLERLAAARRRRGPRRRPSRWARRRDDHGPARRGARTRRDAPLAAAGDRAGGARAPTTALRRRLRTELGARPSRASRAPLAATATRPAADARAATRRPAAAIRSSGATRAGRAGARVARRRDGEGGVVVLVGEAGIGKTRLAEELARPRRRGDGAPVAACAALDLGGAAPFGLWAELVRELAAQLRPAGRGRGWPDELGAPRRPSSPRRLGAAPAGPRRPAARARAGAAVRGGVELVEWAATTGRSRCCSRTPTPPTGQPRAARLPGRRRARLPLLLLLTRRELPRRAEARRASRSGCGRGAVARAGARPALPGRDRRRSCAGSPRAGELAQVVGARGRQSAARIELARAAARGERGTCPRACARPSAATLASLPDDARALAELARSPDGTSSAPSSSCCRWSDSSKRRRRARHGLLVAGRDGARLPPRAAARGGLRGRREPRRASLHEAVAAALAGSRPAAAEVAHHLRRAGRDDRRRRQLARARRRTPAASAALDEAAAFLREALESAPADTALLLELGETETWRGRTEAARSRVRAGARLAARARRARPGAGMAAARALASAARCAFRARVAHGLPRGARPARPCRGRAPEALAGLAWAEAVAGDVERVDPQLAELDALQRGLEGRAPAGDVRVAAGSRLALDVGLARGHALIRRGRFAESQAPLLAAAEAGGRRGGRTSPTRAGSTRRAPPRARETSGGR